MDVRVGPKVDAVFQHETNLSRMIQETYLIATERFNIYVRLDVKFRQNFSYLQRYRFHRVGFHALTRMTAYKLRFDR